LIAAVVLAGGSSSRMGRPKQTLLIDGTPMLERILETLRRTKVEQVVVVLGDHSAQVKRGVKFDKEKVVVNREFHEGMSSSLKLGLREVPKEAGAALVVLGDQPFVQPETIDRMLEAYLRSKATVVVPVLRGKRGNPVLLDRRLFPEVEIIRGDVGAKSVVRRHGKEVLEVEVSDEGVLQDLDTPADLPDRSVVRRRRSRESA